MITKDDMTCDEFKDLAAVYALGMLDEVERRTCVRHLTSSRAHAGCVEAVCEVHVVTARLAVVLPTRRPSPRAWRTIESHVRGVSGDTAARARRLWELADWLLAATVIGLYLTNAPIDTRRRVHPPERERSTRRPAPGLTVGMP